MEGERKQNDATCRGGCGFFGSSATNGLCSICYKQQLTKMNAAPSVPVQVQQVLAPKSPKETNTYWAPQNQGECLKTEEFQARDEGISNGAEAAATAVEERTEIRIDEDAASKKPETSASTKVANGSPALPQEKKTKTNRCLTCRKKVGLLGFECRCGGLFCGSHRYSDKHDCSFDYRELGAQEIRKNNPVVVSEKIKKL